MHGVCKPAAFGWSHTVCGPTTLARGGLSSNLTVLHKSSTLPVASQQVTCVQQLQSPPHSLGPEAGGHGDRVLLPHLLKLHSRSNLRRQILQQSPDRHAGLLQTSIVASELQLGVTQLAKLQPRLGASAPGRWCEALSAAARTCAAGCESMQERSAGIDFALQDCFGLAGHWWPGPCACLGSSEVQAGSGKAARRGIVTRCTPTPQCTEPPHCSMAHSIPLTLKQG